MKKVITFDASVSAYLKALDAVKSKRDEVGKRKALNFIYFDAKSDCFVSTSGRAMLVWKLSGGTISEQFGGKSAFCTLMDSSNLIAEDTYDGKESAYVRYANVIPDVSRNYDTFSIPPIGTGWGISKKHIPYILAEMISREADALYNPAFFEAIKDIVQCFTTAFYPHIETDEEADKRLEAEKHMSIDEKVNSRNRLIDMSNRPLVMLSADETLTYVAMPIAAGGRVNG